MFFKTSLLAPAAIALASVTFACGSTPEGTSDTTQSSVTAAPPGTLGGACNTFFENTCRAGLICRNNPGDCTVSEGCLTGNGTCQTNTTPPLHSIAEGGKCTDSVFCAGASQCVSGRCVHLGAVDTRCGYADTPSCDAHLICKPLCPPGGSFCSLPPPAGTCAAR